MKETSFRFSETPEPHRIRTLQILKQYPDVKKLMGKNPLTALAILFLVGGMVAIGFVVKDSAWWVVLLVAYCVGAFFNHALFVMVHECSHHLLFKNKSLNRIAAIIANMPHVFPSAISFERYHIKHHSFQGVHELDADLPDFWEARLFNNSTIGKMFWLLLYPFFQVFRTFRLKEIKPVDGWIITNWIAQIIFNVAIWMLIGPKAFFFLLFSFFFSVGLHPLGARWIQEHYLTLSETQETYSYYGPLNTVAFNVGYHNEHHDFPSIPWNKLPNLKKTAPSFYDSLYSHSSWVKLFFRFLFDKNLSLYSRITRAERGKVKLSDESKPDIEFVTEKVS
ncbi:MAG: fatty acid desaturase [Bacteroidetes bacterium]|nr:fatty acid desaturase [Bacteroidota bacterium]MBS1540229.1 fatty acid desaturase [Bacteroidota bacterium]